MTYWIPPEVLEGSSGEDEVEDVIFGRFFPRTRRGKEFFPFPRPFRGRDEEFLGILGFFLAILRTRLLIPVFWCRGRDEARNIASFLGHIEGETSSGCFTELFQCNFVYFHLRQAFFHRFPPNLRNFLNPRFFILKIKIFRLNSREYLNFSHENQRIFS